MPCQTVRFKDVYLEAYQPSSGRIRNMTDAVRAAGAIDLNALCTALANYLASPVYCAKRGDEYYIRASNFIGYIANGEIYRHHCNIYNCELSCGQAAERRTFTVAYAEGFIGTEAYKGLYIVADPLDYVLSLAALGQFYPRLSPDATRPHIYVELPRLIQPSELEEQLRAQYDRVTLEGCIEYGRHVAAGGGVYAIKAYGFRPCDEVDIPVIDYAPE